MWTSILKTFGFWLIKQPWFQFEVIKLVTKSVEKIEDLAEESENKVDDKIVTFVKRNKNSLLEILKSEIDNSDNPIDDKIYQAVSKIKTK